MDNQILQDDLNALSRWEKDWQMSFNIEKNVIQSASLQKKNVVTPSFLMDRLMDRDHNHPNLDIILSQDLKWVNHVAQISSSAKQNLGVIRRTFRHASKQRKFKLYYSLVRPKLEYASSASAWYPYLQKDKYQLDMVQRLKLARYCNQNAGETRMAIS